MAHNNPYSQNRSISCTTSFSPDDPAFRFIEAQSNKSGTIRALLNDATKMCSEITDYTALSEATRLRRFFNYIPKPDPEQVKSAMLSAIDAVEANEAAIHRLESIAGYVHMWRKYADLLVPVQYWQYFTAFIVRSVDEDLADGDAEELDIDFAVHLKAFLSACEAGDASEYATQVSQLDEEFIRLVYTLCDAYDLVADETNRLKRVAPNYANTVSLALNSLRHYYEQRYGATPFCLELDILHRMTLSPRAALRKPTETAKGA